MMEVDDTTLSTKCEKELSEQDATSALSETNENLISDATADDLYSYTKRGEYTTELFKVEVKNLPKYVNYLTLKKLFKNKVKVTPQKIKLIGNQIKFAFVALRSTEDKDLTIKELDGFTWKGSTLKVINAKPVADPFVAAKRKQNEQDRNGAKKPKEEDGRSAVEQMNDKSAPLWRMPVEDQLKQKTQATRDFLRELHRDIGKVLNNKNYSEVSSHSAEIENPPEMLRKLFSWLMTTKKENDKMACVLCDIKSSPIVTGYRGKCEFSIGPDKTVGFRVGQYKEGSVTVVRADECPIVSETMKNVCGLFEKYLKEVTTLEPYDNVNQTGYWKQVTVRATRDSQCMVMPVLHPQQLDQEQISKEKQLLTDFFTSQTLLSITSLYIQVYGRREQDSKEEVPCEFLYGKTHITETMQVASKELKFRISPTAFFQTNASAAEVCYQTLCDLVEADGNTVILDICCGTGTIGLCLASKVKHVIGIELNSQAIEDAKQNATDNNISNVEYKQGRAESEVPPLVAKMQEKYGQVNIVAIIDPPRAGLNSNVMKALRSTPALKKLLYVSCEPRTAKHNLVDLCRPPSKNYHGEPFVPTHAIPIDMFPHTKQCEVIFVYERLGNRTPANLLTEEEPAPVTPEVKSTAA
ncbi:tRNA (uracil-5-)-methyltransferase -like protein A [Halotydeus destructor]|nr:tRNA (uracil-5-)-methyltransferase -like protein A [Halotydeus destructor]